MRVLRTESAERDLDAIGEYYGALNPSATLGLLDRLADAEVALADHSGIGRPGRVDGTRELVVAGTPFVLIYAVAAETLTVLRVLHGRQQWPAS